MINLLLNQICILILTFICGNITIRQHIRLQEKAISCTWRPGSSGGALMQQTAFF
jgi:hypothetical protein